MRRPLPFLYKTAPEAWDLLGEVRRAVAEQNEAAGIATTTLERGALAATVEQGKRIVPVCPYVARWVRGHDDFAESVDRVKAVHLEAVRAANAEADGTTP